MKENIREIDQQELKNLGVVLTQHTHGATSTMGELRLGDVTEKGTVVGFGLDDNNAHGSYAVLQGDDDSLEKIKCLYIS